MRRGEWMPSQPGSELSAQRRVGRGLRAPAPRRRQSPLAFLALLASPCLTQVLPGPATAPAQAQQGEADAARSAAAGGEILVVSLEKIRNQSKASKSLAAQSAAIREQLNRDFREQQRALAAEEKALVALRSTLEPDAFEARAARFEQQVRALKKMRRDQSLALRQALRQANEKVDRVLQPILAALMAERKAVIMIDNRDVVISATSLDVTQNAINRLDAALPSLEVQWPIEQNEE